MKRDDQTKIPSVRLFVAGVCSLLLLVCVGFPVFAAIGVVWMKSIIAVVSIFVLVILTPVVIYGSWKDRLLALLLAIFPSLILLSLVLFRAWAV
jgi:hypothetical protein